jgi:carboxylesterase
MHSCSTSRYSKAWYLVSLLVKISKIRTFGVFAGREFKSGETLHRMSGPTISRLQCASRIFSRRLSGSDLLQVRANRYLRLDALSRRFNHSCSPNAALRASNELVALVDIPKGAEVTFDYAITRVPAIWSPFPKVKCTCAASNCRGTIGDLSSVPKEDLRRHHAAGALNDQVLEHAVEHMGNELSAIAAPSADAKSPSSDADPAVSILLKGGRTGVLLLHGLGGTPAEMRDVAEGLHDQGYTVFCPRLAGYTGTYEDLKEADWKDWSRSGERALARLRARCDFVVVGGLSTGAVLSLYLASRQPHAVDGLLLYAPTLWLNGWVVPLHARLFRIVHHKAFANCFDFPDLPPHGVKDPHVRQQIRNALHSGDGSAAGVPVTPGGAVLEHRRLVQATLPTLSSIQQPVLIMHSREDDYAHLNNAEYLQRHLSARVDTVILEDSYHIITADRQRDVVTERSSEFVARISRQMSAKTLSGPATSVSDSAA